MNRMTLTKIHLLLAAFMFPVALMFLVTGGLYTWRFKGSYVSTSSDVSLASGFLLALQVPKLRRMALATAGGGVVVFAFMILLS